MSINYTILKSSIIFSSIWNEDAETCKVWITMLAMRNKDGEIYGSFGGLAHTARIPLDITAKAIKKFLAPEADSSSGDDGRRLIAIPGGWKLINHERIKAEAEAAGKNAYMAAYMRRKRAVEKILKDAPAEVVSAYDAAVERQASESELQAILTPYLKKKKTSRPVHGSGGQLASEAAAVKALVAGDMATFDKLAAAPADAIDEQRLSELPKELQ